MMVCGTRAAMLFSSDYLAAFDARRVDARSGRSTMMRPMKMDFMKSSGLVFLNHQVHGSSIEHVPVLVCA